MCFFYRLKFLIIFGFFLFFVDPVSAEWPKCYGTWEYYTDEPVTLETHFKNIEDGLDSAIYGLLEDDWRLGTGQDEWLQLECKLMLREIVTRIIDDAFIAEAITRGDIGREQQRSLEQWRGMTLKEAVQKHVKGVKNERFRK